MTKLFGPDGRHARRRFAQVRCHESLERDRDVLLAAVTSEGRALEIFADEIFTRESRRRLASAVTQDGESLMFADDESLQADDELVATALQ